MTARLLRFLVLLLATGGLASAAAASGLEAEVSFEEAAGSGRIDMDGRAWALRIPMQTDAAPATPALFMVEGARIHVRMDYRDYAGTPAAIVERPDGRGVEEKTLEEARLHLVDARRDMHALIVPVGPEDAPAFSAETPLAIVAPVPAARVSLWSEQPGFSPPPEFQHVYDQSSPVLRVTTGLTTQMAEASGSFVVHLWEMDLAEHDADAEVFRSGIHRTNGQGESPATPDGAAYDARMQLLTLTVTEGSLRFRFPERSLDLYFEPGLTVDTLGSWSLAGAEGTLAWSGDRSELAPESDVQWEGEFHATFSTDTSRWAGSAEAVSVDGAPVTTRTATVLPALGPNAWKWGAAGAGVLALMGVVVAYRARARNPGATEEEYERLLSWAEGSLARDGNGVGEALVAKGVALLKLDRADEVVATFAPGFQPENPAAAVHAYLLSLAHLALENEDEAAGWIVQAVRLHPSFADEVHENEAFSPIRHHPRVEEALGTGVGGPGYA